MIFYVQDPEVRKEVFDFQVYTENTTRQNLRLLCVSIIFSVLLQKNTDINASGCPTLSGDVQLTICLKTP